MAKKEKNLTGNELAYINKMTAEYVETMKVFTQFLDKRKGRLPLEHIEDITESLGELSYSYTKLMRTSRKMNDASEGERIPLSYVFDQHKEGMQAARTNLLFYRIREMDVNELEAFTKDIEKEKAK